MVARQFQTRVQSDQIIHSSKAPGKVIYFLDCRSRFVVSMIVSARLREAMLRFDLSRWVVDIQASFDEFDHVELRLDNSVTSAPHWRQ